MTTQHDPHAWLRDDNRDSPTVLAWLDQRNSQAEEALKSMTSQVQYVREALRRHAEAGHTGPRTPDGAYQYWEQRDPSSEYHRIMRADANGVTQTILDPQALAAGGHYSVGSVTVSDDHNVIAWTSDTDGSEKYTITVYDLRTEETLLVAPSSDAVAFGPELESNPDGSVVYATTLDDAMRTHAAVSITVADGSIDELVRENDEHAWVEVRTGSDRKYLIISSESKTTTRSWVMERARTGTPIQVSPVEPGVRYWVDTVTGHPMLEHGVLGVTSVDRGERSVVSGRVGTPASSWGTLVESTPSIVISDAHPCGDHLVVDTRENGFSGVAVLHPARCHQGLQPVRTPDEGRHTVNHSNVLPQWQDGTLRVTTSGYTTPDTTWERPVCSGTWNKVHQDTLPKGVTTDGLTAGVLTCTSHDGTEIPVSYIAPEQTPVRGVLLYGYGAYGATDDPGLVPAWVALAQAGVVCATAHVRGGGEKGEAWHNDGRLQSKPNTFHDFNAAARHCRDVFGTARVVSYGGSAGGLLVGASLNLDPELYSAAIADVPFVDCLATMSDPTLPLTITEYEEWGDPADPEAARVIAEYTPVLNVVHAKYPPVLATAGIHDPRVGYWEAAKWTEQLRSCSTSGNPVLLRVRDAGHAGGSELSSQHDEMAEVYGFALAAIAGEIQAANS